VVAYLIEVHRAVDYRPVARYDLAGGYLNLPGLIDHDPNPPTATVKEPS
jgi:hypothetical protein